MTEFLIPPEKMKEGFDKETKHIESLLESSEILFNAKKFSSSLSLSILAHEEIAKLRLIRHHYRNETGITKKEWFDMKKGGSHKKKLMGPSIERKKHLEQMGEARFEAARYIKRLVGDPMADLSYSQMKDTDDPAIMGKLDDVKQDCFYLDWVNQKWSSISTKISKNQIEAMAHVNLEITKWFLNQTVLLNKHPTIELDPNSDSFKKYANDPLLQKDQIFKKYFFSNKFKKWLLIATKTLDHY